MDLLDRMLGYDRFTTDRVLALRRNFPDGDPQEREHMTGRV